MYTMLSYNGKEFKNTINDILHEEILTDIMHDYGTGDEEQFEKHITDIITLIYKNEDHPKMCCAYVENGIFMVYKEGKWIRYPSGQFIRDQYITLHELFRQIQKPFSYYFDSFSDTDGIRQKIEEDDPLKIMKHLDAFVNDDDGYGWDGTRLVDRETIDTLIKLVLTKD